MVVTMMVALLFQVFTPSTTVFAEGNLHNNVIKSIKLTKADLTTPIQTIGESQQMQLVADFSLPNNTVKEGDRTVIQIPNELAVYKGETFPIKNTGGEVIANAVVDPDTKTITLTYTKYSEEHSDVSGSLHVTVIVDNKVVKQAQTLHLAVDMGNSTIFNLDFDYTGIIGDNPDEALGKWSYFDKDDPTIVHCRIRVNAKGGIFPYIKVTDTLESESVSYIKESVEIKKGKWKLPDGGGYYILENETDVTNQFPLTYNGNSFTVQFDNIQGEGYIIKYDVKLGYTPVNQEVIKNRIVGETNSQQLLNTLTMALYQQSGGEANGYNYTIKIHKESEDGTNLSGAKFEVIRNSTKAKVGEIITDEVGNGSLGGLLKDNYTLKEIEAPKGYILDATEIPVTPADFGTDKTVLKTVKNKPVVTSISIEKKWIGPVKDFVTVHLYADDADTGESATLNALNGWRVTFDNLRKFKADGTEIKYTIKEDAIENYKSEITGDMTTGFTVKNTNTEKVSVPVMKQWVGKPTDKVEVKLFADNKEKETATLTAATDWKHIFKDLPKYDENDGHEIVYTIEEIKIDGYTTGISGTAKDGFTVINTITGKVSVPVTKKWVGTPIDSIMVNLYADGKKIDSQKLSKDNNWQYIFKDLAQYRDGKEITYTIDEERVNGYTTTITGNARDGYIITNTKDTPKLPKTGDSSNVGVYAGLLLLSGTLLVILGLKRREEAI